MDACVSVYSAQSADCRRRHGRRRSELDMGAVINLDADEDLNSLDSSSPVTQNICQQTFF